MGRNYKKNPEKPVENQKTAAWASAEKRKAQSEVAVPDVDQVQTAKDYVDDNQK